MILCGEHAVVYHRPAIAVPLSQIRARAEVLPSRTGAGLQICARDLGTCYGLSAAPPNDPLAVAALEVLRRLSVPEPDATLTIRSDIPVASGLGSGAAVAVAEIRALTRALGCELAPATVSALTYEVERIHHGTPSGIDNTVIAFEQPVFYESGRPIEPLRVRQSLELIVADSGMPSSTREAVKHVRSLWNHDREQYDGIFDSIAAIVEETRTVVLPS